MGARKQKVAVVPTRTPLKERRQQRAGGSARTRARPLGAGDPPEGELDVEARERVVLAHVSKNAQTRRHATSYAAKPILEDADKMLPGIEDAPLFDAIASGVTVRHFVWLRLLRDGLQEAEDEAIASSADHASLARTAVVALEAVSLARVPLASVAQASGVPASLLVVRGTLPSTVLQNGERMTRWVRERCKTFANPTAVLGLVDDFEKALAGLRVVVEDEEELAFEDATRRIRRDALKWLTVETLHLIAHWGRAAVGADWRKKDRYRLNNIFKKKTKKQEDPAPSDPSPED